MGGIPVPKRLVEATHSTVQPGLFTFWTQTTDLHHEDLGQWGQAGHTAPFSDYSKEPLFSLLSEQLFLAYICPRIIWWFLLSSYMKKPQALPTPQDARTHAGCKTKETGKVMMKQERRCWAQDHEGSSQALSDCLPGVRCDAGHRTAREVHRHLATVHQERGARGWGGGEGGGAGRV